jgi:hypothetical protein
MVNPFDVATATSLKRVNKKFSERCPLQIKRELITEKELYNQTYNKSKKFRKSIQKLEKLEKKFGYTPGTHILKQKQVLLTDIIIDKTIQRPIDPNHVAAINSNLNTKMWMPLSCFKPGKKYLDENKDNVVGQIDSTGNSIYVSIDGQHTIVSIRSAWEANQLVGYDPAKGQVPVINIQYIETDDVAFAREFFELINGKGKKKLSNYDKFTLSVIHYELYGSKKEDDQFNWRKFQIMKYYDCYPIDTSIHKDLIDLPGTISHFPSVNKQSVTEFETTMKWYDKFFHRESCHYSLFMIMNGLLNTSKQDSYFSVTDSLLDELGSLIINCFGGLNEFQEAVMEAYQDYNKNLTGVDKEPKIESVIVPLLLQLYHHFGGKAPVTRSALAFCNNYSGTSADLNLLNIMLKNNNL